MGDVALLIFASKTLPPVQTPAKLPALRFNTKLFFSATGQQPQAAAQSAGRTLSRQIPVRILTSISSSSTSATNEIKIAPALLVQDWRFTNLSLESYRRAQYTGLRWSAPDGNPTNDAAVDVLIVGLQCIGGGAVNTGECPQRRQDRVSNNGDPFCIIRNGMACCRHFS